jgi:AbrB family looped-hinge helix DNA binding protein
MTHRIGPKGQVVIPKAIRERVGLRPGEEVDFALQEDRVVVFPSGSRPALGGRFRRTGMAARLLEDRGLEPR